MLFPHDGAETTGGCYAQTDVAGAGYCYFYIFKIIHQLKIPNSFLVFDFSLFKVLKGDTCHSHSSTLAEHSLSTFLR